MHPKDEPDPVSALGRALILYMAGWGSPLGKNLQLNDHF